MKAKQLLLGAMMAIALVSCSGKESLIKDYENACSKGDEIKAERILNKLESKYKDTITEQEEMRISTATSVLVVKILGKE